MRKTISVDIDGVLAQFTRAFVPTINSLFPEKNVPLDFEPNDWTYTEILNDDEFKVAIKTLFETPFLWRNLEPYQNNLSALDRFIQRNDKKFDLYYVTSRAETPGDSALTLTSDWLRYYWCKPYNSQILVVKDAKDKLAIMRGLKIEASIDDYLPTVIQCQELPNHKAFLLDRPWNRKDRPEGIRVVQNLEEYFQEIQK